MSCGLRNETRPLAAGQSVGRTVQSDGKEMAEPPHCFLPNPTRKPKVTKSNGVRGQEDKVNEGNGSRVRNTQHHLIPLLIRNGYKEALLSVRADNRASVMIHVHRPTVCLALGDHRQWWGQ